jgi:hypothetical protein
LTFKTTTKNNLKRDKKSKKSHKKGGIKVFLTAFCLMIEGSGSIHLANGSGSGTLIPRIGPNILLQQKRQTDPGNI